MPSTLMRILTVSITAIILTACSGSPEEDLDAAKRELVMGCVAEPGTTMAYCQCMAEYLFSSITEEQRTLLAMIAALPPGLSDSETARRLGTSESLLRTRLEGIELSIGAYSRLAIQRRTCRL